MGDGQLRSYARSSNPLHEYDPRLAHVIGDAVTFTVVDSADVDTRAIIGDGTSIWHLAQVR